jgi:hypothetical protein
MTAFPQYFMDEGRARRRGFRSVGMFRVQGLRFRVRGLGFRVKDLGFGV